MKDSITVIYCVCDDYLREIAWRDDRQCRWSSAQVMTTAIVAALHFGGNMDKSRRFLLQHGYIHQPLSKSRLCRRLLRLIPALWQGLARRLGEYFKQHNVSGRYLVDSLPWPVCRMVRCSRCRLFPLALHRALMGYCASRGEYFYGFRVHLLTTEEGAPVEFVLAAGSSADLNVFKQLPLDLPAHSAIYADKAYNDYAEEELLQQAAQIQLQPLRKSNLLRQWKPWHAATIQRKRQVIESAFGRLVALLPRHLKAVTSTGIILKIHAFLLALAFQSLQKVAT